MKKDAKPYTKILFIVAAAIQGIFLYTHLRYALAIEDIFKLGFIISFIISAIRQTKGTKIAISCVYFSYACFLLTKYIDVTQNWIVCLYISSLVLAGIVVLLSLSKMKSTVILLLSVTQIALLIIGTDLTKNGHLIYVLIELLYILSLNVQILVIMIDSAIDIKKGKKPNKEEQALNERNNPY